MAQLPKLLTVDANSQPVQSANGMTGRDGNNVTFPVASGTTEVALKFPANSLTLTIWLPSNAGTIREISGGLSGWTIPITANQLFTIPGQVGDTVYIGRDGGASVLNGFFELLVG